MDFGIPKEVRDLENRVGLTPAGVSLLVKRGARVWVERQAGMGCGYTDQEYVDAGASIVYSAQEVYGRAQVVAKVARPKQEEYVHFTRGQTILSWLHLAVASRDLMEAFREKSITAIGYETIRTGDGHLPVLTAASEIAGRLAGVIAAQLLTTQSGGRGILLGGIPGVPPAAVVIIGAGVLGMNALRSFLGMGAQITILDINQERLRLVDETFGSHVSTLTAYPFNIEKSVSYADVLLLAVLTPGKRAPILITRQMLRQMKPDSVLIDFSIDQGGACETSRPTTLRDPVYRDEGIIHYCVPYATALAARTSSRALTNASLDYLLSIAEFGVDGAVRKRKALARGVNMYHGRMANPDVAASLGVGLEESFPFEGSR